MGTLKVDDNRFEFITLRFVDRTGITQIQLLKIAAFVVSRAAISEIDLDDGIGFAAGNALDIAYIAVTDVIAVLDLHHLVARSEDPVAVYGLRLAFHERIYLGLQTLIQSIDACFRLLPIR